MRDDEAHYLPSKQEERLVFPWPCVPAEVQLNRCDVLINFHHQLGKKSFSLLARVPLGWTTLSLVAIGKDMEIPDGAEVSRTVRLQLLGPRRVLCKKLNAVDGILWNCVHLGVDKILSFEPRPGRGFSRRHSRVFCRRIQKRASRRRCFRRGVGQP